MEDNIMTKLGEIEKGLKKIQTISTMPDSIFQQESTMKIDQRLASVELHLKTLANALCLKVNDQNTEKGEVEKTSDTQLEREDRKRLKQRLKDALEYQSEMSTMQTHENHTSWAEYIFGICRPDGRMGKEGSRSLLILMVYYFPCSLPSLTLQNALQTYPSAIQIHARYLLLFSCQSFDNHSFLPAHPICRHHIDNSPS
jgi:hypothetical protein